MNQEKLIKVEDLIEALSGFDDVVVAFKIYCCDEYAIDNISVDADGNVCLSNDGPDDQDYFCVEHLIELLEEQDQSKYVYVKLDGESYYIDSESAYFDDNTDDEDEYEVVVTVYTEEDFNNSSDSSDKFVIPEA